jgi:hypothetical protein
MQFYAWFDCLGKIRKQSFLHVPNVEFDLCNSVNKTLTTMELKVR